MNRKSILAVLALVLSATLAMADPATGKLSRDLILGAAHDVSLKAGQSVQILGQSGGKTVIMVTLADGSNGVFQVDAADVTIATASPAAPPSSPAPTAPALAPPPVLISPPPQTTVPSPPLAAAPTPTGPPTYPDDFAGGEEIETTAGTKGAGTASVVHLKGQTQSYIVSARHLLGPDGGFPKQTAAADVPAFVQAINIHSFSGGTHRYTVTGLAVPTKRLKADGGGPMDDMAVYLNQDSSAQDQALPLADKLPALQEPLWVIAHVRAGVPEGQVLQPGKVDRLANNGWIIIQFDNDNIVPAGASGAPVLNAAGEVVGTYSGHNNENGHVFGFIVPSTMITQVIKQSPAPPSP